MLAKETVAHQQESESGHKRESSEKIESEKCRKQKISAPAKAQSITMARQSRWYPQYIVSAGIPKC